MSARTLLIGCFLVLVGLAIAAQQTRTRSGLSVLQETLVDCDRPGTNDVVCGMKFCVQALTARNLLPARVPIVRWDTREARRKQDLVSVTQLSGEYVLAGRSHYVQCEMVGRTPMSAIALTDSPFDK